MGEHIGSPLRYDSLRPGLSRTFLLECNPDGLHAKTKFLHSFFLPFDGILLPLLKTVATDLFAEGEFAYSMTGPSRQVKKPVIQISREEVHPTEYIEPIRSHQLS